MEVAFSSILVRLSGAVCVVLTALIPVQAQIPGPADASAFAGGTEDSASVASSSNAAVPDTQPGDSTRDDLPYVDFSAAPSPASSSKVVVQDFDDHPAIASANDAVLPQGVSNSPQVSEELKTAGSPIRRSMYPFLNYVPMSCDAAFDDSDDARSFVVMAHGLYFQNGKTEAEITPPGTSQVVSDEQPQNVAVATSKTEAQTEAPRRMMSDIRLGESLKTVSETGEPLPTPESVAGRSKVAAPVEHHFVPAPWVRSHASRNTFPIRYQPLYFEDPNMERCGDSNGLLTEATSIAHFAARIPLLPYLTASNSPHDCVNALPDCPTCSQFGPDAYLPRPTVKAIAAQAAATVAGVYIIP